MKNITLIIIAATIGCLLGCSKNDTPSSNNNNANSNNNSATYTVSTIAGGSSNKNYPDGAGSNAGFVDPWGLVVDGSGNLYVTDIFRIRKVTQAGVVTTLAGNTASKTGYADGPGASALFNGVKGIVADASGNLYVCDSGNGAIRKITPDGVVSTLAGKGYYKGSPLVTAYFQSPLDIAIDAAGNLYVIDAIGIMKLGPDGITNIAPVANSINSIIMADDLGNIYFTNYFQVNKSTPAGVTTFIAGNNYRVGFTDDKGTNALFGYITDITTDRAGNAIVCDNTNCAIRKITPEGVVSTIAGGSQGYADGPALKAQFNLPNGITTDASGNIYVADSRNYMIRKMTKQ